MDKIEIANKIADDHGEIGEATGPGVGNLLLAQRGNVKNQGAAAGLDGIEGEVEKVKRNDGNGDGSIF